MSEHKQTCPTCGQSVNLRRIKLGKHHVQALLKIGIFLKQNNVTAATMAEIKPHLTSVQYSTLNQLRKFEPSIIYGKRGTYEFDVAALRELFRGGKMCIEYHVDPLKGTTERVAFGTVQDAKGVIEFLDENNQFVAQYIGRSETKQGAPL